MQQLTHYKRLDVERNIGLGDLKEQNTVAQQELDQSIQLLDSAIKKRTRLIWLYISMGAIVVTATIGMILKYLAYKDEQIQAYKNEKKQSGDNINQLWIVFNETMKNISIDYGNKDKQITVLFDEKSNNLTNQYNGTLIQLQAAYLILSNTAQSLANTFINKVYTWVCVFHPNIEGSNSCENRIHYHYDPYNDYDYCDDHSSPWFLECGDYLFPGPSMVKGDDPCINIDPWCRNGEELIRNSRAQENLRNEWSNEQKIITDAYNEEEQSLVDERSSKEKNLTNAFDDEKKSLAPHPAATTFHDFTKAYPLFFTMVLLGGEIIPALAVTAATILFMNSIKNTRIRVSATAEKYNIAENPNEFSFSQLREKFKITFNNTQNLLPPDESPLTLHKLGG